MKQALILCGGRSRRLRPYSYSRPKPCMPFLNLPLLSLGWLYLELLGVSRFLLNAYLFPEQLKHTVDFLSQARQETKFFVEDEPLGGAGTLRQLKSDLQKESAFFYLNGDSLFFPSDQKQLFAFKEEFFRSDADGFFFACPRPTQRFDVGALWGDKDLNLKFIGAERELPKGLKSKLLPFYFSGLALFKSVCLDSLKSGAFHLFQDFINPLLEKKRLKIFSDRRAVILEANSKQAYLKSLKFCLDSLFERENMARNGHSDFKKAKGSAFKAQAYGDKSGEAQAGGKSKIDRREIKKVLESCFARFDPQDQIVGLNNGKIWSKKLGGPLLAPQSAQGLGYLKLSGGAVLGAGARLFGASALKDSVLGPRVSWRGALNKEIVLSGAGEDFYTA